LGSSYRGVTSPDLQANSSLMSNTGSWDDGCLHLEADVMHCMISRGVALYTKVEGWLMGVRRGFSPHYGRSTERENLGEIVENSCKLTNHHFRIGGRKRKA